MVWPGEHVMVYGMAWRASHGVWYDLAGLVWYIVWPGGIAWYYGMVWWAGMEYGTAMTYLDRPCHIPCDVRQSIPYTMVWPGGHHIVYGMDWRTLYGIWHSLSRYVMVCGKA